MKVGSSPPPLGSSSDPWPSSSGTYDWFFTSADLNGTGRYFVGIGEFKPDFDLSKMSDPAKNKVSVKDLANISMNYYLRVFTSGCYFFDDHQEDWRGRGMAVSPAGSGRERVLASLFVLGVFLVSSLMFLFLVMKLYVGDF